MVLLYAIALVVRIVTLSQIAGLHYFLHPVIDPAQYDGLARQLFTSEQWWRLNAFNQAPGYAIFLAFLYKLTNTNLTAAHVLQVVVTSLTAPLVYLLGKRFFTATAGIAAAVFVAFNGPLIFYELDFYREPLLALIIVVFLLLLRRATRTHALIDWLGVGAMLAASVTIRETMLIYVPLALYLLWTHRLPRQNLLKPLAACLIPILLLCSWVARRNERAEGKFTFVSSQGGLNFYIGNTPGTDHLTALFPGIEYDNLSKLALREAGLTDSYQASQWFYHEAKRQIMASPWTWIKTMFKKTVISLGGYEFMPNEDVFSYRRDSTVLRALMVRWRFFVFPFGLIGPLAILGCWMAWKKGEKESVIWFGGFILLYLISMIVFHVRARYRLPVIPLFCLLAGVGVAGLVDLFRQRQTQILMRRLAVLAGLVLALNFPLYDYSYAEQFPINYYLAKYYQNVNQYPKALETYEKALQDGLLKAEVYNDIAALYLDMGQRGPGIRALEQSVALAPNHEKMRVSLGTLYNEVHRPDLAEIQFRAAIEANPYDAKSHVELGKLIEKRAPQEAEKEYRQAIDIGRKLPGQTPIDVLKGAKEGLWRLGISDISDRDVIAERQKTAFLQVQLAKLEEETHRADLSTKEGRIKASDAYSNLGAAYLRVKDYPKAEEALVKSLTISYEQTPGHINLGMVYRATGRTKKAIHHYQEAIRIVPENYIAFNNLGRIYEEQKDFAKAIEYYKKGLQYDPDNKTIQHNLERAQKNIK